MNATVELAITELARAREAVQASDDQLRAIGALLDASARPGAVLSPGDASKLVMAALSLNHTLVERAVKLQAALSVASTRTARAEG